MRPQWWKSSSPTRSFVLGAIFLALVVVAAVEPTLRADPVRMWAIIVVALIASGAQVASGVATLISRRRASLNAERPDSV